MTYIIDWIEFDWDESIEEVMETLDTVNNFIESQEEIIKFLQEEEKKAVILNKDNVEEMIQSAINSLKEEKKEIRKEYIRESILLTIDARIEEFKTSLIEDVREMMKEV